MVADLSNMISHTLSLILATNKRNIGTDKLDISAMALISTTLNCTSYLQCLPVNVLCLFELSVCFPIYFADIAPFSLYEFAEDHSETWKYMVDKLL